MSWNVPFEQKTGTWNDHVANVEHDRAERVGLDHATDSLELLLRLGIVDLVDEGNLLADGQISPVGAMLVVAIVRKQQRAEDRGLVIAHVAHIGGRNMLACPVGAVRCGQTIIAHRLVTHLDDLSLVFGVVGQGKDKVGVQGRAKHNQHWQRNLSLSGNAWSAWYIRTVPCHCNDCNDSVQISCRSILFAGMDRHVLGNQISVAATRKILRSRGIPLAHEELSGSANIGAKHRCMHCAAAGAQYCRGLEALPGDWCQWLICSRCPSSEQDAVRQY